jgi:hypothetical protein
MRALPAQCRSVGLVGGRAALVRVLAEQVEIAPTTSLGEASAGRLIRPIGTNLTSTVSRWLAG